MLDIKRKKEFYVSNVKCAVCGKIFDKEKVKCVRYNSRRYAHYDCFPEGEVLTKNPPSAAKEQTDGDYRKLTDYIFQNFGPNINWAMIGTQIKKLVQDYQFTYSGILKSLHWFYDVKQHPHDKAEFFEKGLGIVPYVYEKAYNYYYKIYQTQEKNENTVFTRQKEIVKINSPRAKRKRKLFNLEED